MNENPHIYQEIKKSLFSKLEPSVINKGETDREFYQYKDDPSKIIRIETYSELIKQYDNLVNPELVVRLGKKLFSEIDKDYNIKAPVEIVTEQDGNNKEAVFIITDKIEGISVEEAFKNPTPIFLEKLETLYISISKYYLDKYKSGEAHLADLNNMSQYVYGKKTGDTENQIYLVDTDLYLNKGDTYLLHNVKWFIRHMPKRYEEAISNVRSIIEAPLSDDLNEADKILAEKEIKKCLNLLSKTSHDGEPEDDEGFIVSALD